MRCMKSCFFIGHREADESILPRLRETVGRLIVEENVGYFYVGNHGGFDRLAAHAVMEVKRHHQDITLTLVLSCHPGERPVELPEGFDGSFYPEGLENVPRRYALVRANRIMVDICDWLVCYVWHTASNSKNLLEYARRREKKGWIKIENLAEKELSGSAAGSGGPDRRGGCLEQPGD